MKKKDPKCGFTLYDIKNLQYKQPIKCHEHPPPHQKKKKSINDCLYSLLHYSVFGITVLKNEADANQMLSRW